MQSSLDAQNKTTHTYVYNIPHVMWTVYSDVHTTIYHMLCGLCAVMCILQYTTQGFIQDFRFGGGDSTPRGVWGMFSRNFFFEN